MHSNKPLALLLDHMAMASGRADGEATVSRSGRRRVLLVEDVEINRVVARRLMTVMDVGWEEAENGKVAVDFIQQGRRYDLILMDKEMPVLDGHEATRQLRSLGVMTPIIGLSANSLQADKDLFLEAGADDFQAKPLSRDKLMWMLTKYGIYHDHGQ